MIGTFGMFVKYPEPGRVKTRLAAAIGDEWATALYVAFLIDLIPRYSDLQARRVLAYSPNNEVARRYFEHLNQGAYELWPQPEGPLGRRMQIFFEAFRRTCHKAEPQPGSVRARARYSRGLC